MEKRFDKIEEKLDQITTTLADIKVTQAEQAKDLKYHIKRTDLSEERITVVEEKMLSLLSVKDNFSGIWKMGGVIGGVIAGVVGLITIIQFILTKI